MNILLRVLGGPAVLSALGGLLVLSAAAAPAPPLRDGHRMEPRQTAQPGQFDYYVLTLSWSPEFCHSHPANPECSKHYGFVVHGLWPQFEKGGFPENCSQQPGLANPARMLDIMPALGLIQHEWATHGTCSGLDANGYFDLIRQAFQSITIPSQFVAPASRAMVSPVTIKQAFEQANPALRDAGIAVGCSRGYLTDVEICMTKDLIPRPCTAMRDCTLRAIHVAPVR